MNLLPFLAQRVNLLCLRLPNAKSITLWSLLRQIDTERTPTVNCVIVDLGDHPRLPLLLRLAAYAVARKDPPL